MQFAAIIGALVISACVHTAAVPCGDGTVCAPGTVCNLEHGQCLTPDQLESCVGKADGELCPVGTDTGICDDELCFAVACGDGVVQGIEQCDGAPPLTSCFDLGYDAGFLGCNDSVCAADLRSCHHIGWKPVAAPSTGSVTRLASAGGVGYAVRGELALRFRAGSWEPISSPSSGALVFSIYAAAADDVWAVTEDGLFRFDGTTWNRDTQVPLLDRGVVTGAGPNDVYLFMTVNSSRTAMHFDGTAWSPIAVPSTFVGLAWAGPAGIFVSSGSSVEKLSGGVWQSIAQPLTWVHHLTGFGTTVILSGTSDAGAAVAIGDGTTWSTYDITNELGWTTGAVLVGGRSADDLYAIAQGESQVVSFDGARWLRDGTLSAGGLVLDAIGPTVFAGTSDGIARESAASFAEITDTLPESSSMAPDLLPFSVWGRSCDDLFIALSGVSTTSAGQIVHFDGSSWTTELDVLMPLTAMSGSPNAAYAATYDGTLLRRSSSTQWIPTGDSFPTPLRDISAADDGTLVLLGDDRWLHVFDGGAWRSEQLASTIYPSDVLALSRDEVYAVERSGLLRWDGASWVLEPLPEAGTARAIWGLPGGPLIVVGANGQAWHRVQGSWTSKTMPYDEFLSVHGTSAEDVFALGANGTIAHFAGEEWAPLRQRLTVGRSVWNGASCTYFAGNSFPPSVARLRRSEPW
ncbi:MAG: hypothetical protein SFX73_23945 [Kofleriaceae bacterium]|nr:hypothetical protein [Kofleriaceae bacterium]